MGKLQATGMPYIQVYNGTLIQAPNLTAYKCDICGQSFFDSRAVGQLEALIGAAGPPPNYHHSPPTEANSAPPTDDIPPTLHPPGAE